MQDDTADLVAVCTAISNLPGGMVAEPELKRHLGLVDTRGHRAWRKLRDKLLAGGFLEEQAAAVEVRPQATALDVLWMWSGSCVPVPSAGCK